MKSAPPNLLLRIRILLAAFILGLILSGVTAFPLRHELDFLASILHIPDAATPADFTPGSATHWITTVRNALRDTDTRYPFLAYGTDWLGFAHLVIALAFLGPFRNPVRNRWVTEWGILCCLAVFPLALIAGPVRSIPFPHQLVDCSFGALGLLPLLLVRHWTLQLEKSPPAGT